MSLGVLGFALGHLGFLVFLGAIGSLHDRVGDFGIVFPVVILLAATLVAASSITIVIDFRAHHPLFFNEKEVTMTISVILRSEIAGTKPPYVCPGCFIHKYSNNMINKLHVQ
jgi:hypothetical protein